MILYFIYYLDYEKMQCYTGQPKYPSASPPFYTHGRYWKEDFVNIGQMFCKNQTAFNEINICFIRF